MLELKDCMHCGLCLEECPTYQVSGNEANSPRGRLFLIRAIEQNELEFQDAKYLFEQCLMCRACEPACPSGVPYTELLEEQMEGEQSWLLKFAQTKILKSWRLLKLTSALSRFIQKSMWGRMLQIISPSRLKYAISFIPQGSSSFDPSPGKSWPAIGKARGRVAVHLGCLSSQFFGDVIRDTIHLYTKQGFEVVIPEQPPCCGSIHSHSGNKREGQKLGKQANASFADDYDAVLVMGAGCAAHLREKENPLIQDPIVFLQRQGFRGKPQAVPINALHSPPCHLKNVLGEADQVHEALASVPELNLRKLNDGELCCGAGGITFLHQEKLGQELGDRKLNQASELGATTLIQGNPLCITKLSADLKRSGIKLQIQHPVSILNKAYQD